MNAALAAPVRRRLADSWARRARLEMEAAQRFERLAGRLHAVGAPPVITAGAARAAHDERLHVLLCADLAASYAPIELPAEVPPPSELAPRRLRLADRVLYELVAQCCVTETINASTVLESLVHASHPAVRPAVRRILADEVAHARVGWGYLALRPPDPRQAAWLSAYLPDMLAGAVGEVALTAMTPLADDAEAARHGQLPPVERLAVFVAALRRVLFPGLAAHGIDPGPGEVWLAARLARG